MNRGKGLLSLALLAAALIGIGGCRVSPKPSEPTPTPTVTPTPAAQPVSQPKPKVVIPFEMSVELKGDKDRYCIEGFSKEGARRPQIFEVTNGLPFFEDPTNPPPETMADLVKNVQYVYNSPVEVTDCKGKVLKQSGLSLLVDYNERKGTKERLADLYISIPSVGDYKFVLPLTGSKAVETQAKDGEYPIRKASIRTKVVIPEKVGKAPQTFSYDGSVVVTPVK